MSENNLTVGQNVILEVGEESSRKDFPAIVKKFQNRLVALLLEDKGLEDLKTQTGASARIKSSDIEPPIVFEGKIIQTKASPLIILKLENTETSTDSNEQHAETDSDIAEAAPVVSDSSYDTSRDSARIIDSFLVNYFLVSKEKAEQKKNEYLLRPTMYRREKAKIGVSGADSQTMEKISHFEPGLQEVINDIYLKIKNISTQKDPEMGAKKDEGENEGECIDLSGTGFRMICGQKLNRGDILKVIIAPPQANPTFSVSALAEVKNVETVKVDKDTKYSVGVQYYSIHEQDMENIIGYTFQLQREQLNLRKQMTK